MSNTLGHLTKTIITPHIDEGKGISLQRNETTGSVNWDNGRILIANNICYYNGFSGIHSNDGNRIDIINNSCYFNSYTKSVTEWTGTIDPNGGNIGISLQGGTGHKIINNISVIDNNMSRSAIATDITASGALVVKDNIIYGSTAALGSQNANIVAIQVNTQNVNPQWVSQAAFNFNLLSTSPAINAADAAYAPTIDYYGNTRTTPDIGAIEFSSVLPIELLYFSGQNTEGGKNYLTWQTANESKNAGFDIEASQDGVRFEKIGFVKGNGTTNDAKKYNFTDEKIASGLTYYRLKQVDIDGRFEYSKIISVLRKSDKFNAISVSPNPANDVLNILVETKTDDDLEINLLDIFGKTIKHQKMATQQGLNNKSLDLQDLPNGIYFLQLQQGSERIVRKVIKE
ncbi:MAG: T9SS type A sorting domain-containing protein [Saprospiraceae bacterium]|nr:T9SS type A sorting domain-containing protein [Saprospiraceae bacterium]